MIVICSASSTRTCMVQLNSTSVQYYNTVLPYSTIVHQDPCVIESRGFIESVAREEFLLVEHATEEFVDDQPGAPYPTY